MSSINDLSIDLYENERILEQGNAIFVNGFIPGLPFFESRETGLDGKMIITNQRVYFKSKKHLLLRDLLKQEFSINLADVSSVEQENLFFILPFFIVLKLNYGSTLKFSFGFSRSKWFDTLKRMIK